MDPHVAARRRGQLVIVVVVDVVALDKVLARDVFPARPAALVLHPFLHRLAAVLLVLALRFAAVLPVLALGFATVLFRLSDGLAAILLVLALFLPRVVRTCGPRHGHQQRS